MSFADGWSRLLLCMQLGNADLFEALNSSLMTSVSKFHEQLVEKEDYIATNLVYQCAVMG